VASILHSVEDLQWWQGLHIDELIPAIKSLIPCNADAPLEADLRVCLLLYEETKVVLSSSAKCLHFGVAEKIMEEGRTGVDGGKSLLLDSGLLFTGASFRAGVGGSIPPSLLVATTVAVLLLGAVNTEFTMALWV
jgi:hypothetical protein